MDYAGPKIDEHIRFVCPECSTELDTQMIWRKHLNTLHDYDNRTVDSFNFKRINDRFHECNECHKWVSNQSITTLQYHYISHLPFNLTYKCRHCSIAFARKRSLCDHLLDKHKHLLQTSIRTSSDPNTNDKLGNYVGSKQIVSSTPNEFEMQDNADKYKKDQGGDIIHRALLDSLIDLENERAELVGEVSSFPLNQTLNDLEDIFNYDLDMNNVLSQQYSSSLSEPDQYTCIQYSSTMDGLDNTDDEVLEQICAEIFEEIVEPIESITIPIKSSTLPGYMSNKMYSSSAEIMNDKHGINNDQMASTNAVASCEEKIIRIEIDAVNETERRNMYSSPKRKRLKLELAPSRTLEMDDKLKKVLETYILYLCPECGKEFKTQSEWRTHVFRVHDLTNTMYAKYQTLQNGNTHICLDCREVLTKAKTQDLMRHRFTHMPFQSYLKCTFCGRTKSSKPKMMLHMQDMHANTLPGKWTEKKPPTHLNCSFCEKSFQTRSRLQLHRQSCGPHKKSAAAAIANNATTDANIMNNLNLIAHLKKMRARMRTLKSTNAEPSSAAEANKAKAEYQ